MVTSILEIKNYYFSDDKRCRNVSEDFYACFLDTLNRITVSSFILSSNNNPDINNGISDVFTQTMGLTHESGTMIHFRNLLNIEGAAPTGGSLVKDLSKLSPNRVANDIITNNRLPDSMTVEYAKYFDKRNGNTGTAIITGKLYKEFINSKRKTITDMAKKLSADANKFIDKGYISQIIDQYQKIEFHKDRFPEPATLI